MCEMSDDDSGQGVQVYTDGACSPNPGLGGYSAIIKLGDVTSELSGGFRMTTNNRMEMVAAIEGVASLPDDAHVITVFSDSRYLVDMFNGGYAQTWRANGWRLSNKKKATNIDLWTRLLELAENREVVFSWVKGHDDHPENERCDEMAVLARQQNDLPVDVGYEERGAGEDVQLSLFD